MSPGLNALVGRGFQVDLVQILAPDELSPATFGDLRLVDSETGAMQEVTFGRFRLKAYRQTVQNFMQRLREFCQAPRHQLLHREFQHRFAGIAAQATAAGGGVGMKGNPKSEGRRPKEGRNPKSEGTKADGRCARCGPRPTACFELGFRRLRTSDSASISAFGFGSRPSDFGFRSPGMHFLAPLAFAFAAAIPVVIVFYLLKRKRVVKLVSSTLLWQKFLAETQASAPFQRLRKNWLLILQIILLMLAVLALTRPYFSTTAKPAQRRVVILDASASMQATDESPSRFEKARAEALKWVDSLKDTDEMVIVLAGATTEVKQSATSEKAALRRALQACICSDGPTRLIPALRMAESLVRDLDPKTGPEIHLFSDGAVPELNEFENKALPLVYHRVGKGANNLGITALDVRANPEDARQRAIYASVANFSPESRQTDLELLLDDRLLETRPLTIPAGETSPQVFRANQSRDGVFTVRLTAQDDLAVDNQASIVSLLPKPVKVLLVSRGNRLLEKALRAVANVELASATDLTDTAAGLRLRRAGRRDADGLAERQRAGDSRGEHELDRRGEAGGPPDNRLGHVAGTRPLGPL